MADEENTAAMAMGQQCEAVEHCVSPARADVCTKIAMQGIDNQQARTGSLERIFQDRNIVETQGGRLLSRIGDDPT
jgi:hypothetical protein